MKLDPKEPKILTTSKPLKLSQTEHKSKVLRIKYTILNALLWGFRFRFHANVDDLIREEETITFHPVNFVWFIAPTRSSSEESRTLSPSLSSYYIRCNDQASDQQKGCNIMHKNKLTKSLILHLSPSSPSLWVTADTSSTRVFVPNKRKGHTQQSHIWCSSGVE